MENQFEVESLMSKSEIILEKCRNMMRPEGLEQFQFRIEEQFYKAKQNKVLLIHEQEGDDLQTMLAFWIQEHQQRNKDLIIPYFVEHENQNHYYSIYYILTKLRTIFNITQKVELESEKLKQYFEYWLHLCCRELGNQLYSDSKVTYKRVIIIFQGIDKFKDNNGEVRVSSWLPKILPENIKMIVSARINSKAYDYYQSIGNQIIQVENEIEEITSLIKKKPQLYSALQKTSIKGQLHFLKVYYTILNNDEYQAIVEDTLTQTDKIHSETDFFTVLINSYCQHYSTASAIFCVLSYVCKGVAVEEIMSSCNCTADAFLKLYQFFQICFLEKNKIYSIYIPTMKQAITQIQFNKNLYEQYLLVMEHSSNSTRKLEELIYQYTKTKKFFKLKEIIINIEHFLILWNPQNKFELCQLWETLEQNGYDLVMEYNKAVENFQAIYKPTSEGLFYIMLQICIFLREFSNFEKDTTPAYKHPELRGQSIEFEEVGLFSELSQLKMLAKKKSKQPANEDYFPQQNNMSLENLNLDIKNNKEYFINHYQNQFDASILAEYLQTKQEFLREKLLYNAKTPNPYYYKRWLWVQFPWLALTQKNNFSKLMQFYGKDSTQYMSIQEEIQINQKAIRLVINAKNQKEQDKKSQKFPTLQKQRYYSPLVQEDSSRKLKLLNQSLEKNLNRSQSSSRGGLPELKKKGQFLKKLDQLQYQNTQLKNRLKELQTIKQNLYPQEATIEANRLNEVTKIQVEELKKQTENLALVQQEMKRMATVLKLCHFNQDYNEERVQQLFKHCNNLDRTIAEYAIIIHELNEKLGHFKTKIKTDVINKPKTTQLQATTFSKQLTTKQELTMISQRNLGQMNTLTNTNNYQIKVTFDMQENNNNNNNKFTFKKATSIKNIDQQDKLRETQTRLMLEQMPSNRMITPGYRLSLKLKNDFGDSMDSHTLESLRQLQQLNISTPYNNPTFDHFLEQLHKYNELTLEVQECTAMLSKLKFKKQEQKTFLKILQKNEKPQIGEKPEQYVSQDDVENLRRVNDSKTVSLKKLKQQKAVYDFFKNNLYKDVNAITPIREGTLTSLFNVILTTKLQS